MWKHLYHGMGKYARLILRRDRIRIPTWIIILTLLTIIIAPAFIEIYPSEIERQAVAESMRNPAMIAMLGPAYGIDNYDIGAMMAHQMLLFTALAVAVMSILLVTRHTRTDEEEGRIEMIRSFPTGRLSNLSATLTVLIGTNILLAMIMGVSMYALGIESMDLQGSLLYAAALGATGIFFAAITALFAQLSENSRGTLGYSFAFLGLAYLIRAVGDVSSEALAMTSPLGWILRTEVYVNNYWWPIILTVGASLVIVAFALYLNSIRDLGAGFIPAKPGRKTASSFLQNPLGLSLRLQRTAIMGWLFGMFMLGASYGSIFGDVETFFADNELMQQMIPSIPGFSITEQFLTMLLTIISMAAAIPAILMILKLRGEEKNNRTEHLFARAVSRTRLMGSYLTMSIVVGFLAMAISAIGLWSAGAAVMDDPIALGTIFNASMAFLPAIWIMTGVAVFLVGYIPQGVGLTWLYLAYSFVIVYLGGILQFPDWMSTITPFGHIPRVPIETMTFTTFSILTVIALALIALGFMGYNKRDIQG